MGAQGPDKLLSKFERLLEEHLGNLKLEINAEMGQKFKSVEEKIGKLEKSLKDQKAHMDDLELQLNRLNREIRVITSLNWLTLPLGIPQEGDVELDIVGLPQPASTTGFGSIKRRVNIEK